MRNELTLAIWLAATLAAGPMLLAGVPGEGAIDFNRDIRPILADNCYACHGPDAGQRKGGTKENGGLRLDIRESALADLGGYAAVVPGNPNKSELVQRVLAEDPDDRMPPVKHRKKLTAAQKQKLVAWIREGAVWSEHWSFIPPEKPPLPTPVGTDEPSPIDRFIRRQLQRRNLEPSAGAERRILIRRLSFDLTGLPPTQDEVRDFLADPDPEAYENLVDRLLASPHHGERMAMYWLDVVRFADSNGYHSDEARSVGPYREYVIDAFNANKPFDRFLTEQLAGDLLPNATIEHKVASGFNMLLQTTNEGGAQPKEYLAKYMADRVRNTGTIFLGLTTGCAECHDHKFDPFTTRDFYSFGAFFADIREAGKGNPPTYPVPSRKNQEVIRQIDAQIADLRAKLSKPTPQRLAAQRKWERDLRAKLESSPRTDFVWFDDKQLPNGKREGGWNYVTKDKGPVFSGSLSRRQQGGGIVQHFVQGAKDAIKVAEGDVFFAYVWIDPRNPPKTIMLQFNDGSWEHRAYWGEDRISFGGIGKNNPGHRRLGPLPKAGQWVRLEATPQQVGLAPGRSVNGMAFTQFDGLAYWDQAGVNQSGVGLPQAVVKVLLKEEADRSDQEVAALQAAYLQSVPEGAGFRQQIAALQQRKAGLAKSQARTLMTVTTRPRPIRILPRGNWLDQSGPEVQPAIPEFFGKLETSGRPTRLDLARWMVDGTSASGGLTARTFVNRVWKLLFGSGLSGRLDDLGSQGEWPTHPQLLDWLAVDFIESGWDVKRLVKNLVMTRTYRQVSTDTPLLRRQDPNNRYYARQSRWRLDAEMIRDNALAVSGLLATELGGRSVKPYQPPGYWRHMNFPKRKWQQDQAENLYRRGLYTWWQRMFLHPSLMAFDAPSREESCVDRPRSNTPQQALTLLNDPTYVEAARVLAQRVLRHGGGTDAQRLDWALGQVLARPARPAEAELLLSVLAKHRAEYRADSTAATKLLGVGARPADAALDPAELAAWTSLTRILLNLHETVTRA